MNQKYPLKKTTNKPSPRFTSPESEYVYPEPGDVLFKLDDWEIHAMIETTEIAEAFHNCNRPDGHGVEMAWSYQIPNDDHCPGCDAIQPDEIQGLVAMYNFDKPARQYGKSVMEQLREDYEKIFTSVWKSMSVKGDGFK